MGAIAAFGQCVLNDDIIHACHVPHHVVDDRLRCEAAEVERRELRFRRGQPAPDLSNQIVLLVDDGLATGATMRAAIRAVQSQKPASIHVAVPVAAADSTAAVRAMCQTFAAIEESDEFDAVGSWYEDFSQVSDEEVCQILDQERGSKHERFQVSKDRGQNRVP
jgi:predicted phosphoribosyltransferase